VPYVAQGTCTIGDDVGQLIVSSGSSSDTSLGTSSGALDAHRAAVKACGEVGAVDEALSMNRRPSTSPKSWIGTTWGLTSDAAAVTRGGTARDTPGRWSATGAGA
jgi:hypothetical protein